MDRTYIFFSAAGVGLGVGLGLLDFLELDFFVEDDFFVVVDLPLASVFLVSLVLVSVDLVSWVLVDWAKTPVGKAMATAMAANRSRDFFIGSFSFFRAGENGLKNERLERSGLTKDERARS
jgi:hypothetical protein